jgi:hypothetical protein
MPNEAASVLGGVDGKPGETIMIAEKAADLIKAAQR